MGEKETCEKSPSFTKSNDVVKDADSFDKVVDKAVKFKIKMCSVYFFATVVVMPLVFLIAILWHSLHWKVSVFTGRLSPRGWYIDENALDPAHFDMNNDQYPVLGDNLQQPSIYKSSLCQALRLEGTRQIICHPHRTTVPSGSDFDVARIQPKSGAVSPISESIILVVPWWTNIAKDNSISQLQMRSSILHLLRRLSESPWLAKTILVVAPAHNSTTQKRTVDSFVNVYFGVNEPHHGRLFSSDGIMERLPFAFESTMIRSLLAIDCVLRPPYDQYDNIRTEIQILPMGSSGSLPNMDLTYTTMFVYSRARFMQSTSRYTGRESAIVMHQHQKKVREWTKQIEAAIVNYPEINKHLQNWLFPLFDLLLFEYSMAIGPYPPHSNALDMGIDALSVYGVFTDSNAPNALLETNECIAEFIEKLEYLVRSLSNLHERLHHSTSLYLLPSPYKFVKHEEYLVPNILLVIPCIVRTLLLVFILIKIANFEVMFQFLALTIAGTFGFSAYVDMMKVTTTVDSLWTLIPGYIFMLLAVFMSLRSIRNEIQTVQEWSDIKHSIHICACMVCLLIHVSLAFGHVSLSVPSAIFWTILIAFPRFGNRNSPSTVAAELRIKDLQDKQLSSTSARYISVFLKLLMVLLVAPFPVASPWLFPSMMTYILYAYVPLHIMFSMLVLI